MNKYDFKDLIIYNSDLFRWHTDKKNESQVSVSDKCVFIKLNII